MEKYDSKVKSNYFNLSIDGLDVIAEEVTPTESFNRRETIRKNIIGGTQHVIRGNYIARNFTVIAHFMIDPDYPDIYDETFREWQSKPVEVISRELGGKFDAEIIIKRSHNESPNFLRLEMNIVEIPTATSNIPNDSMKVKADELKTTTTTTDNNTNNSKGSNVTTTTKTQQNSNSQDLMSQVKGLVNNNG